MINRIVVGAHYGLKDWIIQRVTAIVMALYTVVLLAALLVQRPSGFEAWREMFASCGLLKMATFLFFASLFYHAWIGMRDLWMDYVKPVGLRLTLHVVTVVVLVVYTAWVATILWRL
ncbi:MAG: succinate dehydrogenase, hydrophobic membrane anchor protein [Azonexus sp.]